MPHASWDFCEFQTFNRLITYYELKWALLTEYRWRAERERDFTTTWNVAICLTQLWRQALAFKRISEQEDCNNSGKYSSGELTARTCISRGLEVTLAVWAAAAGLHSVEMGAVIWCPASKRKQRVNLTKAPVTAPPAKRDALMSDEETASPFLVVFPVARFAPWLEKWCAN